MNPYKVLNITPTATPRDIVQASAQALRDKKHSARDIAEARQQLMNPAAKLILDFVYSVDLEPLIKNPTAPATRVETAEGRPDLNQLNQLEQLKRLDVFDRQI
jgi:hypothetical protein